MSGSRRVCGGVAAPTVDLLPDEAPCFDADREAAVERARGAVADGRLTLDDYSHRLDLIWTASTHGELRAVLADLLPVPLEPSTRSEHQQRWRPYITVMVILVGVWALTTPGGYFWPIWPALGWGIPNLLHHHSRRTHLA